MRQAVKGSNACSEIPLIEVDDHLKEGFYARSLSKDIYSFPRSKS